MQLGRAITSEKIDLTGESQKLPQTLIHLSRKAQSGACGMARELHYLGVRAVGHGGRAKGTSVPQRSWLRKSRAERPCCQHVRHTDIRSDCARASAQVSSGEVSQRGHMGHGTAASTRTRECASGTATVSPRWPHLALALQRAQVPPMCGGSAGETCASTDRGVGVGGLVRGDIGPVIVPQAGRPLRMDFRLANPPMSIINCERHAICVKYLSPFTGPSPPTLGVGAGWNGVSIRPVGR
jgi:hypothetical protein